MRSWRREPRQHLCFSRCDKILGGARWAVLSLAKWISILCVDVVLTELSPALSAFTACSHTESPTHHTHTHAHTRPMHHHCLPSSISITCVRKMSTKSRTCTETNAQARTQLEVRGNSQCEHCMYQLHAVDMHSGMHRLTHTHTHTHTHTVTKVSAECTDWHTHARAHTPAGLVMPPRTGAEKTVVTEEMVSAIF